MDPKSDFKIGRVYRVDGDNPTYAITMAWLGGDSVNVLFYPEIPAEAGLTAVGDLNLVKNKLVNVGYRHVNFACYEFKPSKGNEHLKASIEVPHVGTWLQTFRSAFDNLLKQWHVIEAKREDEKQGGDTQPADLDQQATSDEAGEDSCE